MRTRIDYKYRYFSLFDERSGKYLRSGILEKGKDTGVDPFMSSFPELLDVGIMGHCAHGLSGRCALSGVQCYQTGGAKTEPNMTLADYCSILEQSQGNVYQIALGGRGDPDMHESFEEILKETRAHGIVPNFTTSGMGFSTGKAELCKQYCGAVAVSWYRAPYTYSTIQTLLDAGVKTNIHYVLGDNSIDEAIRLLQDKGFPEGINAVVFLLHKPVGAGQVSNMLRLDDPRVRQFFELVGGQYPFRIGFDSCSIPALIQFNPGLANESVDTCEGARWSAYITPDMHMLPCSFDNASPRWAVDLRTHTIQEAWDSPAFEAFRAHFRTSCPDCPQRANCMGGCPIVPDIVLCGSGQRKTKAS